MGSLTGWRVPSLEQKKIIFRGNIEQYFSSFSNPGERKWAAKTLMELAGKVRVVCPCGSTTRDPLMLACSSCSMEQHAACYRVLGEAGVADSHVCLECSMEGAGECTDPGLVEALEVYGREGLVRALLYRRLCAALLDREQM